MKCGPNGCPIVTYDMLTPAEKKEQRKTKAQELYERGFTQEQIANQLHVNQSTITRDLDGLCIVHKPPRPKGGRPKGSTKPRGGPKPERRQYSEAQASGAATLVLDEGLTYEQAAERADMTVQTVKTAVAREEGRREPQVERADLPISAQEKLDAAIRRCKRELEATFERRVQDEVRKRIDEMILPHWKEKIDQAQKLYRHRRGAMDKATFNKIRRALHPDSRNSISDKVLGDAFDTFMSLEKFLLDEKDSPTDVGSDLPSSLAEWDKRRRDVTAARKAGHTAIRRT